MRYDPTNFNFNAQETYTLNNLQPDTTYSIIVSVHNGVSGLDAVNANLRACQIVVATIPGSKFDQLNGCVIVTLLCTSCTSPQVYLCLEVSLT